MTPPTFDEQTLLLMASALVRRIENRGDDASPENAAAKCVDQFRQVYLDGWCAYAVLVLGRIAELERSGAISSAVARQLEGV